MCPAGCPSIYGERQEHTWGWKEGRDSMTDKRHRMDFGKTMNPKRRLFPAWVSLGGLVHGSYSEAMGLLEQRGAGCAEVWRGPGTLVGPTSTPSEPRRTLAHPWGMMDPNRRLENMPARVDKAVAPMGRAQGCCCPWGSLVRCCPQPNSGFGLVQQGRTGSWAPQGPP